MIKPWLEEPNHVEFRYKGFPCIIHRVSFDETKPQEGHLCGYVGIPSTHPYYGKQSDQMSLSVHGGITYTEKCNGAICHKPSHGETDDLWWLGFDCGHCYDLVPRHYEIRQLGGPLCDIFRETHDLDYETYRTIEYVENEIKELVDQLLEVITE